MMLLTQSFYPADDPNMAVGFLGLTVLVIAAVWAFMRWVLSGPARPDPWSDEVAAEISRDDATPICHRCFTPHKMFAHFCPNCGTPVGPYTNLMPFPYVFSVGHVLRLGTDGAFRRSPLTMAGFILIGIAEYAFFAPVYWFMFLRRQILLRKALSTVGAETDSSAPKNDAPKTPPQS